MAKIVGGCLCGTIRYATDAEPALTCVCHCTNCQRQTGTAFSILVAVPKGSLKIQGDTLGAVETVGESGQGVTRRFCRKCGSPILSEVAATPALDWVKAGTLDDTSWLQPQMNIWCDSAQSWVKIDDRLPQFDGNPPFGD
jgi:hypothetical protein